jgi:hypothetical protein
MSLLFCAHLARAIHDGIKTTTWKPLSAADNDRRLDGYQGQEVLFAPGTILVMDEPWGLVGSKIVLASSFTPARRSDEATPPDGWRAMIGSRPGGTITVGSCSLRRLATITEDEARLAGTAPPDGDTYLAEFERQWRGAYRGGQAWDENPYCWLIAFTFTGSV